MVPMRDGVALATDIYLPSGTADPGTEAFAVIVERTPYNKSGPSRSEVSLANRQPMNRAQVAGYFAAHGLAVAMQDCRGRYGSQGEFEKYLNEADDGYDTLAWLVAQPWCNGKVGTMGLSYGAHTQCALASQGPPGLACMFMDSGGFASAYHGGIRRGGAFEMKQATWAYRHALRSPVIAADPARAAELNEDDIIDWFRRMPWEPGHSPLRAAPEYEAYLFRQWREGLFSDYWRQPGLYAEGYYDRFPDVPTAILGSWYDPYVLTCITNYRGLSARNDSRVELTMGPWTHGDRSVTHAGDVDFGPQATLDGNIAADYLRLRLDWFRRWLLDGAGTEKPPVRYFQMGGGSGSKTASGRLDHGGCWREARQWPPAEAREVMFYPHADGSLRAAPPQKAATADYRYDPRDPVPTIGGALTSGEPVMRGGAFDQRVTDDVFVYRGRPDGRPLAARPDILVFETPPLEKPLVVTGAVAVQLFVSSDCVDTDFTAKLVDVYPPNADFPDGFAMNITDGIFRMRYREGWDRQSRMQPGAIYQIRIEPFATSNLFQAGHRLRLDISSSNYPHFDINPNTGAPEGYPSEPKVALNRIHLGGSHASCLVLPVTEAE
jgi:putative CocE/NonD family hydrolase